MTRMDPDGYRHHWIRRVEPLPDPGDDDDTSTDAEPDQAPGT